MKDAAVRRAEVDALARALAEEVLMDQPAFDLLTPYLTRLVCTVRAGRGRIMSYSVLAQAVAKDHAQPLGDSSVRVYLSQLRRVRPDLAKHIETVRGRGLRWIGPQQGEHTCHQ